MQNAIVYFFQIIFKVYGLTSYIILTPIISLMIILPIFGFNFLSVFATSVFLGFVTFLHFSMFSIKFDNFGMVELGNFNKKKFFLTVFILPILIGNLLKLYNIDLHIEDLYYFWQIYK